MQVVGGEGVYALFAPNSLKSNLKMQKNLGTSPQNHQAHSFLKSWLRPWL